MGRSIWEWLEGRRRREKYCNYITFSKIKLEKLSNSCYWGDEKSFDLVPKLNSMENDFHFGGRCFSLELSSMIILTAMNIKSILILEEQIELVFH